MSFYDLLISKFFGGGNGGSGGASVQSDWSQNDPNASGYVKGRTHWEETIINEPITISWDGNTEGLDKIPNGRDGAFRVSDITPTYEQMMSSTITRSIVTSGTVETDTLGAVASSIERTEQALMLAYDGRYIVVYDESYGYPTGLYIPSVMYGSRYCSSITIPPIEQTKTVVHKLDKKYLPDDVGGGATVFYVGIEDDDYLYHDKETAMKVSKDEYRLAMSSGVVIIETIDEASVYYPSLTDFGNNYATVSLWNDGNWRIVHTGERVDAPPV